MNFIPNGNNEKKLNSYSKSELEANANTANGKSVTTLDQSKKKKLEPKHRRFLSSNDSLINSSANNSIEMSSDSKKINKKILTAENPSKSKTKLNKNNSIGKKTFIKTSQEIPIPKGNKIKPTGNTLKGKLNSSVLFNIKERETKINEISGNVNYNNSLRNNNNPKDFKYTNINNKKISKEKNINNSMSNLNNNITNNYKNRTNSKTNFTINQEKNTNYYNNMNMNMNMNMLDMNGNFNYLLNNNNYFPPQSENKNFIKSNNIPSVTSSSSGNNNNNENLNNNNNEINYLLNESESETNIGVIQKQQLINSYNLNMKVFDELSSYKLKTTKLENEILLLNEKIKSSNQTQIFYSNENEILRSKLNEIQEDYKRDLESNKKNKSEAKNFKKLNKQFTQNLKTSINSLLEIIELLLAPRSNIPRQSLMYNDNNSYSIDIYDSYNNEEERRNVIFEQIQSLLISKLTFMKKSLNVNFDAEIEKIKNWGSLFINNNNNKSNNNDINVSNIKMSVKNYESSSYESSKKNISQDFFDLSISNQFLKNNSPKFLNSKFNINNSFGVENESPDKIIKLNNKNSFKGNLINNSNNSIISQNVFSTNNFLSAGNLSLNNINLNNPTNTITNKSITNNKEKDNYTSITNINNLSLSNINSNNINNNGGKENNDDKSNNQYFNDSFLKDLNSGQYDSFNTENRTIKSGNQNEHEKQIRESSSNNEEINMNIEDCSMININAENTENNKTANVNKMFSFDLNDEQQDFNNDLNFNSNPLNIRETIENEINEKENLDLSFKEKEKIEKIPPKEFVILPATVFDTK